jgi:hypothetical protein
VIVAVEVGVRVDVLVGVSDGVSVIVGVGGGVSVSVAVGGGTVAVLVADGVVGVSVGLATAVSVAVGDAPAGPPFPEGPAVARLTPRLMASAANSGAANGAQRLIPGSSPCSYTVYPHKRLVNPQMGTLFPGK